MFQNILVCVDGTVHSERALDEAIDLADAGHGRLTLLTAVPRPPCWAYSPITAPSVEPLACEMRHEAEAALTAAVDRVPDSIPVTKILSEKPIRDVLIQQVKSGKYDLVVMGSRGRGALTASVLGSVSHYALNHCGVPVLIIHSQQPETDPSPAQEAPGGDRQPAGGGSMAPGGDSGAPAAAAT
jgi:nucleotide-binding universal stress UspA family protein